MSLMAPVFGYWVGLCQVPLEGSDIRLQGRDCFGSCLGLLAPLIRLDLALLSRLF